MSMSKKDFIALADDIREHNVVAKNNDNYTAFTEDQIELLAQFCRNQNSNFMRERWLDYIAGKCGKNGGKIAA